MNSTLDRLTRSVAELMTLYEASSAGTEFERKDGGGVNGVFLSQLNLADYHRAEELFTQEMTAFTKKQFFEVSKVIICI